MAKADDHRSDFGVGRWALGSRRWAFGARRSAFSIRHSAFGIRCSAFGVRRFAFGVSRSAFRVQRSRLLLFDVNLGLHRIRNETLVVRLDQRPRLQHCIALLPLPLGEDRGEGKRPRIPQPTTAVTDLRYPLNRRSNQVKTDIRAIRVACRAVVRQLPDVGGSAFKPSTAAEPRWAIDGYF